MIAIPATAILVTNLDFWEKIRAVCKIVAEQRTALARSWSGDPFALLSSAAAAGEGLLAPAVLFVLTAIILLTDSSMDPEPNRTSPIPILGCCV